VKATVLVSALGAGRDEDGPEEVAGFAPAVHPASPRVNNNDNAIRTVLFTAHVLQEDATALRRS
jgi:hypothetical protein